VQDSFLIALRSLDQLREPEAFAGWLRQIAITQAHRRFRKRKLLRLLGLDRQLDDATLSQLAHAQAGGEVVADLALLDEFLRGMPARERVAWMLRHVEGYALDEVADACRCSLASAKRRIAAASARLQAHLGLDHE
jgi:RNA polymerase sigma-70 factor (ECF subfamily)